MLKGYISDRIKNIKQAFNNSGDGDKLRLCVSQELYKEFKLNTIENRKITDEFRT